MIVYPNAKINVGLNIVARRPDGYHDLETVFYPVALRDTLSIETSTAGTTTLSLDGIPVAGNVEDNLVMRAYRLLEKEFSLPPVRMALSKHIPSQAGLGGGSSDAAFTLRTLNELFALRLTDGQLENYAGRLGADCPFFIRNKPVYAEGTGNLFTPFPLSLKGWYLLLVKPEVYVSTKEAFSQVTPRPSERKLTGLLQEPVPAWKDTVRNDFEDSVFPVHPELRRIKETLYALGAAYASMSGSGSSLYGIFPHKVETAGKLPADCFHCLLELE